MGWRETVAIGAALFILLMVFNSSTGGIDRSFGLSLASEVAYRVMLSEEGGQPKPVSGALVVLGLERGWTGDDGTFRFSVAPGRYSSYVKLPDARFAVVVLDLRVERDLTVELTFETRKASIEEIRLNVGGNGTRIKALVSVPRTTYAFASSPVILAYLSDGSLARLAPYQDEYGYFGQSLIPGAVQEVEVEMEVQIAAVIPNGSYVPVQLVEVKIY
ncbi:MAG: hypothetical protein RMJ30_07560 [Nitrososphaerota archaeon]|nr:hypothetical protein [Nitrososphaerota archaeon]